MTSHVVVAGWGQTTQPKIVEASPKAPMGLMVRAARMAAGHLKDPGILSDVDGILVVKSLSVHYPDPARELGDRLSAAPGVTLESGIGGNSPQTMINRAAAMIARGELQMVLVAGAETYVPRQPLGVKPDSALLKGIPEDYAGDDATGTSPLEVRYGIAHPMQGFPLFETALWASSGLDLPPYLDRVAEFWSGFSRVAAGHAHAWCRTPRTREQILEQGPANRPIAFPYTKYMNAFVTVDQGAAVILMSEARAREASGRTGRTVYFHGGGYAQDRQRFMIDKSDFTASPPQKAAVNKALDRAGMTLSQMDCFDLYSCFPCAVSIARRMMGISEQDPRPMTLTGGLGFFGGPGNNYNLHAVVTLCDMISKGETTTGMVTALGWFMHKHAAGIYSGLKPSRTLERMDIEDDTDYLAGPGPVDIDPAPHGTGIVETYTIVYARDRAPAFGVIYGRTEKKLRFIARMAPGPQVYDRFSTTCRVGQRVTLATDPDQGLVFAALTD